MLLENIQIENSVVSKSVIPSQAVLRKKVSFTTFDGYTVLLPAGTEIFIDVEHGIANCEEYNFDIDETEYQVI